ncbi:J domain-containing protein [Candidatus Uhrbacteria bacterium]|nr:J domain-containing protein [Candidatus Uhrbacteria bacterium]
MSERGEDKPQSPASLYEVLGVPRDATRAEIQAVYRKLAKKYHPDIEDGDKRKMQDISAAWEILGDEEKRREYDRFIHRPAERPGGGVTIRPQQKKKRSGRWDSFLRMQLQGFRSPSSYAIRCFLKPKRQRRFDVC